MELSDDKRSFLKLKTPDLGICISQTPMHRLKQDKGILQRMQGIVAFVCQMTIHPSLARAVRLDAGTPQYWDHTSSTRPPKPYAKK